MPNNTENQIYNHVTSYYQALLDQGMSPEVAKELTVQQVREGGYAKRWWSGDGVKFNTPQELAKHVIAKHSKLYPDSLKATNFDEFYNGLQKTGKYMYNSEQGYNGYRKALLNVRPGVVRRIDKYVQSRTPVQEPVTETPAIAAPTLEHAEPNDVTKVVTTPVAQPIQMQKRGGKLKRHINHK